MGFDQDVERKLAEIDRKIDKVLRIVTKINTVLEALVVSFEPTTGVITQGENMVTGTITGLVPGAADQFFCTPVDVNGNPDQLPDGSPASVFTADDAGVVIGPPSVADPTGNSCTVTAPTSATPGGSFNLTWTATFTNAGGTTKTITSVANVPYLKPPTLDPVGGVISQGSPAAKPVKK